MVPEEVTRVHDQRPELLRANTHASDAAFLYFVCQALGPDWGLLSKSNGENGYTWPNGVRTSHDAIIHKTTQEVRDIIASAGNGQPTSPAWIGPQPKRESNTWTPLSAVPAPGGGSLPPPPPPPPPKPRVPEYEAIGGDNIFRAKVGAGIVEDYTKVGNPFDDGMAVWFARPIYDAIRDMVMNGTDPVQTIEKWAKQHRNTMRKILDPTGTKLPPL